MSNIDTSTTLWGKTTALPLGVSPTAMHRMAHADGEVGTSKACAARRVPMVLSVLSNDTLEDVSAQSSDGSTPYAIQISPLNKRQVMTNLLTRAKGKAQAYDLISWVDISESSLTTWCPAAGYKAVVLTADAPMYGRRLQDVRNGFHIPRGTPLPNLAAPGTALSEISSSMYLVGIHASLFLLLLCVIIMGRRSLMNQTVGPAATWEEEIPWLRSQTDLELWVKGGQFAPAKKKYISPHCVYYPIY